MVCCHAKDSDRVIPPRKESMRDFRLTLKGGISPNRWGFLGLPFSPELRCTLPASPFTAWLVFPSKRAMPAYGFSLSYSSLIIGWLPLGPPSNLLAASLARRSALVKLLAQRVYLFDESLALFEQADSPLRHFYTVTASVTPIRFCLHVAAG